jgi:hypothetical protein
MSDGAAPRLVVAGPSGGDPERRWVLDVVLGRWLGLPYDLEEGPPGQTTIRLAGDVRHRGIVLPDLVLSAPDGGDSTGYALPTAPLARVASSPRDPDQDRLPVIAGDGRPTAWSRDGDWLFCSVDILGTAFLLLSRVEERLRVERDRHGRFPAGASLASRDGFMLVPVVDGWVEALAQGIEMVWPDLPTRRPSFSLVPTHDVDLPYATYGQSPRLVARAVAGDLLRWRDPALAISRARSFAGSRSGPAANDPYDTFDLLMTTSERLGLHSTFYFLAGNQRGDRDFRYRIEDPVYEAILRRVHERGHRVGLHGSYDSHRSAARLRHELDALRAAAGRIGLAQDGWGIRQHYLRLSVPETWVAQDEVGFTDDSSLGWAEDIGFRAGTCRPYPLFDVVGRRPLAIEERPLIVMDAALPEYESVDLEAAAARVATAVAAGRRYGGELVLLYHNSSLPDPRRRDHYERLLAELAAG